MTATYKVTGAITEIKTDSGALIGYIAAHKDATCTVIPGPGHGPAGTYTNWSKAHAVLLHRQGY